MNSRSSDDFVNLIRVSSATIACFEIATPVACSNTPDEFARLLYAAPTRCVDGSTTCAQACGFSDVHEMVGQPLERFFPASHGYLALFKEWHRLSLSGQPFEISLSCAKRSAITLSVAIYGTPDSAARLSRFWIVARDVTAQMRATRALATTELHYRTLIEAPGVIFARVNPAGYYEYISPFLAEALNVSLHDVAARRRKLCEWLHPDDQRKIDVLLTHRHASRASSVTETEVRMRLFGEYHSLAIRQLAALDPITGEVAFIDLIARDVTELRRLESRVVQLEREESPSHQVATLAHDIRNHLTACLGHLENINEEIRAGLGLDATALAAALSACRATFELASTATTPSEGSLPLCDVADVVSTLAVIVGPLLPHTVKLIITPIVAPLPVPLQASKLRNALLNLVLNARDALQSYGGEISISATLYQATKQVRLNVQDNGPGIPPHILPEIFKPYFSTKRDSGGTGLGLASVYKTITSAGGMIRVTSSQADRSGAVFTIELPIYPQPPAPKRGAIRTSLSPQGSLRPATLSRPTHPALRILVADDEAGICHMLEVALKRRGHAVDIVSEPDRFMTQAASSADLYDVLVIDESLPRKRATEILPYLRTIMPRTPIIVTSGDHSRRDAIQRATSSVYFLAKPFSVTDLENLLYSTSGNVTSRLPA